MNNLKQYAGLLNDEAPEDHFLAYITPSERDMLVDAGGVKTSTPSGIFAYPPGGGDWGGSTTGGGSTGRGEDGGGSGRERGAEQNRTQTTPTAPKAPSTTPNPHNDSGSSPTSVRTVTTTPTNTETNGNVDAEDEYLAPDTAHYKATQKAIGKTNKELKEQGLDKSEWTDYTKTEQEAYQKEMNRLNGTEGKNYSFYKGNKGTTNLTFNEHFKDVVVTDPILKLSPTMRLLVAAGRTIQENATTSYGTGSYGSGGTTGSGAAVDQGGWIGKVLNSDGSVKSTLTESEAQNIYQQAQSQLPYQIGNTKPQKSMVNDFFKNMGSNLGVSTTYMNTYNQAKNKISQSLNLTPNTQQFGYTASPYSNYSRSMTSANPYYDELENQGLI